MWKLARCAAQLLPLLSLVILLGLPISQSHALTVEEFEKRLEILTKACQRGDFSEQQCTQAKEDLLRQLVGAPAPSPPSTEQPPAERQSALLAWRERTTLEHKSLVTALAFSPDSRWLTTSTDDIVKLWDVSTLTDIPLPQLPSMKSIRSLVFLPNSPNPPLLAIVGPHQCIIWSIQRQKLEHIFGLEAISKNTAAQKRSISTAEREGIVPASQNTIQALAISPAGDYLATLEEEQQYGSGPGGLPLPLHRTDLKLIVQEISLSPSPQFKTGKYRTVHSMDTRMSFIEHSKLIGDLALAPPKGYVLATYSYEERTRRGSTMTASDVVVRIVGTDTFTDHDTYKLTHYPEASPTLYRLPRIGFSPDGTRFFAVTSEVLHLWKFDGFTLKGPTTLQVRRGGEVFTTAAFAFDGMTLATVQALQHAAGEVTLWQLDGPQPQEIGTLKGHRGPITGVAFAPDGKTLATASEDRTVKLWERGKEQ